MRVNDETNELLLVLALKATYVLNSAVRELPSYEDKYLELSLKSQTYAEFAEAAHDVALSASEDAFFVNAVGHRMHAEIDGLFWTGLAQWLMNNERCHYQRFGTFSSKELPNRVKIEFAAALDTPDSLYDALEPRDDWAWSLSRGMQPNLRAVWQSTVSFPQNHPDRNSRMALLVSEYLLNVLPGAYKQVRTIEMPVMADAFYRLSLATALATYEAWRFAFFSSLSHGNDVIVPAVGVFAVVDAKIRFTASEMFLGMLAANQLQKDQV